MSKKIKKQLREYADIAYNKEMSIALEELYKSMMEWRQGKKTIHQMTDAIHDFHSRASRDIYNRYNTRYLNLSVALAINDGIIPIDSVSPEFIEAISNELAFYRQEE